MAKSDSRSPTSVRVGAWGAFASFLLMVWSFGQVQPDEEFSIWMMVGGWAFFALLAFGVTFVVGLVRSTPLKRPPR